MSIRRASLQLLSYLILMPFVAVADDELRPDYVSLDLAGTALVGRLVPLESQTYDSAKRVLSISSEQDLGFGGRLFTMSKGNGYTLLYLEGFAFKGHLGKVKIGVRGYPPSWSILRERVMKVWEAAGGPNYQCDNDGCFFEHLDAQVIQEYKNAVTAQLGKLTQSEVPHNLEAHYRYLLSPFEVTYVGPAGCGLPPSLLPGREAIDALLANHKIDLITNVLKGYNPGARVYALMALQDARQRGVKLPPSTEAAMAKVRNLPVRVSTCIGDIVNTGLTARDVITYFR